MNDLKRYRVTGVTRATGEDAQIELDALSEANARIKAEFRDIVVTSVDALEQISMDKSDSGVIPSEPRQVPPDFFANNRPSIGDVTITPVSPPPKASTRQLMSSVLLAIGWFVLALASLVAVGQWVAPNHRRDASIEAMLTGSDGHAVAGSIGFLIGGNILGVIATILGLAACFVRIRTAGIILVALSIVTLAIGISGDLRPTSQSLSGTGLTSTTTPQAEQAARDLSRMIDEAIPSPGNTPAVDPNAIASSSAHGELSHILKVAQETMAGMLADANEYQAGILALRLDSILLPMRLDSTAELNESKTKLVSAQRLLAKYNTAVQDRLKAARNGMASAPFTQSIREEAARSFDKGMATTLPQMEQVLSYEAEIYSELTVLLDFMLTQQDKFRQVGSQLNFDDEADAATYNASITRYQAIAAKQIALRELLHENAKANAGRLRHAADTGAFEHAPLPSTESDEPTVSIELSADGPKINGQSVTFPITVTNLESLLGPPSRSIAKLNTIRVWDSTGIYAYSKPGSQEVNSIAIALNRQQEYDFTPKTVFSGSIMLAQIEVRDIDTPRSLNRRLKGVAFKRPDQQRYMFLWQLRFPTYTVGMSVDKGGLSDTVSIRSLTVEKEEPEETKF